MMGGEEHMRALYFNPIQGWLSGMQHVVYHVLHPWLLDTLTPSGSCCIMCLLHGLYHCYLKSLSLSESKYVLSETLKGLNKSNPLRSDGENEKKNNNPERVKRYPLSAPSAQTLKGLNTGNPMRSGGVTHVLNNNPERVERHPLSASSAQTLKGLKTDNPMQSVGATYIQNNNPKGVELKQHIAA